MHEEEARPLTTVCLVRAVATVVDSITHHSQRTRWDAAAILALELLRSAAALGRDR